MKTCALCPRVTSPLNGSTTSADAVLCAACFAAYESSPECRREKHYKKAKHEGAARAALNDYIMTVLKIRQVVLETERNDKAAAEVKAAAEKAAAETASTEKSQKNGVEKPQVAVQA